MKKLIITLCLFGGLLISDRDGIYSVSGNKHNLYDGKQQKETFQGQVFEDDDHEIHGYVQKNRYDRKVRVRGEWSGMGMMKLKDDLGDEYEMEVEEEEF